MESTMDELFLEELKDLYSAESQLIKALPKMAKAVDNEELREAITNHLEETKAQAARLEEIFSELEEKPGRKKCKAMEGLIAEGDEHVKEHGLGPVRDVAIIAAAQRVEHYEMAAYGCARAIAEFLGHQRIAKRLQETLDEEGNANKLLTEVTQSVVSGVEIAHSKGSDE